MVFKKKRAEDKMKPFSTTLKPEAYLRLKAEVERSGLPMSMILTNMILKEFPEDKSWWLRVKGDKN